MNFDKKTKLKGYQLEMKRVGKTILVHDKSKFCHLYTQNNFDLKYPDIIFYTNDLYCETI